MVYFFTHIQATHNDAHSIEFMMLSFLLEASRIAAGQASASGTHTYGETSNTLARSHFQNRQHTSTT